MRASDLLSTLLVAGWHADPADHERQRFFDGKCWTSQVRPAPGAVVAARAVAGWYDDPADPHSLRYFDGTRWSARVMPRPGSRPRPAQGRGPSRRASALRVPQPV